jgi:hypothetical protein
MTPDAAAHFVLWDVIARLEPEVGGVDHLVAERHADRGLLHLEMALHAAKQAMASGDADQMSVAVAHVLLLEHNGRELARAYRERAAANQRRKKGGATRGQKQSTDAQTFWAPWIARYHEFLRHRMSIPNARGQVARELAKAGYPRDRKTISNWCK